MSKTKVILIVIAALLLGMFLGRIGLSQSGNALKSVVEPGSMTSEASYIIFTDGTTVYARNGTTGEIEFSGTNASQVINNAIGKLTAGRLSQETILVKGNMTLDSPIVMQNYTELILQGSFTLAYGANVTSMIYVPANVIYVTLSGGVIDGNCNYATSFALIDIQSAGVVTIDRMNINYATGYGIYGNYSGGITIRDCIFLGDRLSAIRTDASWTVRIEDNEISYSSVNGGNESGAIEIHSTTARFASENIWITDNTVYSNYQNGLVLKTDANYLDRIEVQGNYLGESQCRGMLAEGANLMVGSDIREMWITENTIRDNSMKGSGSCDGLDLQNVQIVHIIDNVIRGANHYNNIALTNVTESMVENNELYIYTFAPITMSNCTNLLITNNQGYVTENSGNATVSNNDWIAHGLAATPSVITLTPRSNATVWVNNRNATHFQVGVSSGTVTVDWHAEV